MPLATLPIVSLAAEFRPFLRGHLEGVWVPLQRTGEVSGL